MRFRYFLVLLAYGWVSYAAVFMLWALLTPYGLAFGWPAQITSYVMTVVVVFALTRFLAIHSIRDALIAGFLWAGVHIALDFLYITPVAGFLALSTPFVWIGYVLVAFTPSIVVFAKRSGARAAV